MIKSLNDNDCSHKIVYKTLMVLTRVITMVGNFQHKVFHLKTGVKKLELII